LTRRSPFDVVYYCRARETSTVFLVVAVAVKRAQTEEKQRCLLLQPEMK
jgi:hypothetical protein